MLSTIKKPSESKEQPYEWPTLVLVGPDKKTINPRLAAKQLENYLNKTCEADNMLTIIGFIYVNMLKSAEVVLIDVDNRIKQFSSIIIHKKNAVAPEKVLAKLLSEAIYAFEFIIEKKLLYPDKAANYDKAIILLKRVLEIIILQDNVLSKDIAINWQFDKFILEQTKKYLDRVERELRARAPCRDYVEELDAELTKCRISIDEIDDQTTLFIENPSEERCKAILLKLENLVIDWKTNPKFELFHSTLGIIFRYKDYFEGQLSQIRAKKVADCLIEYQSKLNEAINKIKPKLTKTTPADEVKKVNSTKNKKNVETITVTLNPEYYMNEAFKLLASGQFPAAILQYENALAKAKQTADMVGEIQSLLTMAECYDLYYQYTDEMRYKEEAVEKYKKIISYEIHNISLRNEIAIYQVFASLELNKLLGSNLSDGKAENEIKSLYEE